MNKDTFWSWITKISVFIYVTIGAGSEIYSGVTKGTVHTSFLFAFLSGIIFAGRIGYAFSSGAKKTVLADTYGLIVLWVLAGLRIYFNGW